MHSTIASSPPNASASPDGVPPPTADAAGARVPTLTDTVAALSLEDWAWLGGKIALAVLIGLVVHALVYAAARRFLKRPDIPIAERLVTRLRGPSLLIFPLLALQALSPTLHRLGPDQVGLMRHVLGVGTIAAVTWLAVAILGLLERGIRDRHDINAADNLEARRVHTQVAVLSRTLMIFVVILGIAAALMTFPRIRELGASLLVSAGFAGLAIGLAARPVLENLIAGVQLAFTQPIRLDDVVIVDGEWGRIEEITTAYVVVRIWDERRLICPFSKFTHESFQNWTRTTASILGTVFFHLDYTADMEAIRALLKSVVESSDKWDGRVCALQVTDSTDRAIQARALVSAANSSAAWDLRVLVREKVLAHLQREHPDWLPRTRLGVPGDAGPDGTAGGAESTVVDGRSDSSDEPG